MCGWLSHAPYWKPDLACNPGTCPDWESTWQPFGSQASAQCAEPHQLGPELNIFNVCYSNILSGENIQCHGSCRNSTEKAGWLGWETWFDSSLLLGRDKKLWDSKTLAAVAPAPQKLLCTIWVVSILNWTSCSWSFGRALLTVQSPVEQIISAILVWKHP